MVLVLYGMKQVKKEKKKKSWTAFLIQPLGKQYLNQMGREDVKSSMGFKNYILLERNHVQSWHNGLCLPLHIFIAFHCSSCVFFVFSTILIQQCQILTKMNLVKCLIYFCQGKKAKQTRSISLRYEKRKDFDFIIYGRYLHIFIGLNELKI